MTAANVLICFHQRNVIQSERNLSASDKVQNQHSGHLQSTLFEFETMDRW